MATSCGVRVLEAEVRNHSGHEATMDKVTAAFVEEICQSMIETIDLEVAERLQAAWKKGSHAAHVAQKESEQGLDSLRQMLAEVNGAQISLEAENERLRQLVSSLASMLSHVGNTTFAVPWLARNGCITPTSEDNTKPLISPAMRQLPSPFFMPSGFAPPVSDGGFGHNTPPFREDFGRSARGDEGRLLGMPPFPFQRPKPRRSTGTEVSLAEVLGITSPAEPSSLPETPCTSLSRSVTPPSPASSPAAGASADEVDAFIFAPTLRLARGADLGITTSQSGHGRHLCMERVLPGGAAEAWNRQCGSSGAADKVLLQGDKIVRVNDVTGDAQAMLLECGCKRLLRFQIVRTWPAASHAAANSSTQAVTQHCSWTRA